MINWGLSLLPANDLRKTNDFSAANHALYIEMKWTRVSLGGESLVKSTKWEKALTKLWF